MRRIVMTESSEPQRNLIPLSALPDYLRKRIERMRSTGETLGKLRHSPISLYRDQSGTTQHGRGRSGRMVVKK